MTKPGRWPAGWAGRHTSARLGAFTSDVLRLSTGTAFAQALAIVTAPFVARLFAPDVYGAAAVYLSVAAVVGPVACLRYDMAIMLPETHEDASGVFWTALSACCAVACALGIGVFVAAPHLAAAVGSPAIRHLLFLLPVSVFLQGLGLGLAQWNARVARFGRLSVAQAGSAVVGQGIKIAGGALGLAVPGTLIGSTIVASTAQNAVLGAQILKQDWTVLRRGLDKTVFRRGAARYWRFPALDVWGALINTFSWQLPLLLLSRHFAPASAAFYSLATTVVAMPATLVGGAVAQVFFQRLSQTRNDPRQVSLLVGSLYGKLVSVAMPLMALLALVGDQIFSIAFGARWQPAGLYAQLLAPWVFWYFISSPLSTIFLYLQHQERALLLHLAILGSRILALESGVVLGSPVAAVALFAASGAIVYGWLAAWNLRLARAPSHVFWTPLRVAATRVSPAVALALVLRFGLPVRGLILTLLTCVLFVPLLWQEAGAVMGLVRHDRR